MPIAALTTLGCKVNQYETEKIGEDFVGAGFALADFDAPADVYVINSCSVTQSADRKSRHLARKAARTNPDAVVVMTGCHSQMTLDAGGWVDGATLLVPNDQKMRVFDWVIRHRPEILAYSSSPAVVLGDGVETTLSARAHRTRATLKVQDGCEHFCGFCSIPYTRKVLESRPYAEVVEEARRIGAAGTREIVVTGVCVGAYGPQTGSSGPDLAELLLRIADQPGVERVRLSSIQPIEVTDALIDAFAEHPNLCPHLHLSCQSGDDDVLRAMNRPYDTDFFQERVARLRAAVPDVAITTDLIVGYPGETRAMHENTLRFAQTVGFQRTHVFRYSPRPRTLAETLVDNVTDAEKKIRHTELQQVVNDSDRAFAARYLGQIMDVLVEGRMGDGGTVNGHTGNYVGVSFPGSRNWMGEIIPVRLTGVGSDGLQGEVVLTPEEHTTLDALPIRSAPVDFTPLPMA